MAITAVRKQGIARQRRSGREWKRGRKMRVNPLKLYSTTRSIHVHVGGVCKEGGFYVLMM